MKKITFLITVLIVSTSFSQELLSNGDFEGDIYVNGTFTEFPVDWKGFKASRRGSGPDPATGTYCARIENGDGSLFHNFNATPSQEYTVSFKYQWINGANTNQTMKAIVRTEYDAAGTVISDSGFFPETTYETWHNFSFTFTVTQVQNRLILYKDADAPIAFDDVSISPSLSVRELLQFNFKSSPNPAKDYINLSASKSIDKVEIYNLLGQQVKMETLNNTQNKVNVSSLSNGIYILKAYIEDAVGSYKFIKE